MFEAKSFCLGTNEIQIIDVNIVGAAMLELEIVGGKAVEANFVDANFVEAKICCESQIFEAIGLQASESNLFKGGVPRLCRLTAEKRTTTAATWKEGHARRLRDHKPTHGRAPRSSWHL